MGYSEFPHTKFYSEDLSELICLYKKLVSEYDGTLDKIGKLTIRLGTYEQNMDTYLLELRSEYIPNAVRDALTIEMRQYDQELNTIRQDLNSTKEMVRTHIESSGREFNEVKVQLSALSDMLDREIERIENAIQYNITLIDKKVEDVKTEIYNKMDENMVETKMRDIASVHESKMYTDSKVSDIMRLIEQIKIETQACAVKWLWDHACNFGGYSAKQWFQDVTISAKDWSEKKFSAVDWYVRGREIFDWWDRRSFMYSPITGKYSDVRQVILELCTLMKQKAISGEEYDRLLITAQEYEDKHITGFEYDWYANLFFGRSDGDVFK